MSILNPHPPLSSVPAVLMTIVVAAELLSLIGTKLPRDKIKYFSFIVLIIACCLSPLTYFSGYYASEYASQSFQIKQEIIVNHQIYAQLYLLSIFPLMLFAYLQIKEPQKKALYYLFCLFLVLSYSLLITTSYKGGDLVFEHGAGVKAFSAGVN